MGIVEAMILGAIQGFTEFLPVSSSGHLELAKVVIGDTSLPEESLTFTVVLHFATALSTLVVFRKDVFEILKGLTESTWNPATKFAVNIFISMLPAVFIGLFFESQLEAFFGGAIGFVGAMLLITALLLLLADKAKNTKTDVSHTNAFVIGVSQAVAMLPGISRSGATIATSVLLGVDRTKAARFSFLMVVPLIFGKVAKDLLSGEVHFDSSQTLPMLLGFATAFITGLIACHWMIALVKKSKLSYFALYCALVGTIAIAYHFAN